MPIPVDLTPAPGDGEIVVVEIVDAHGRPVPTATIRNPDERITHRVNARTGRWRVEQLYLASGPFPLKQGTELELEVRAPGYVPVNVTYEVDFQRNRVQIELSPFGAVVKDRRGRAVVAPDWQEVAEQLTVATGADDPVLTPAFAQSLGTGDPYAAGRMALTLAKLGPGQSEAAFAWATEAMHRARTLEGADFVTLTDRMLAVRALSAMTDWQLAEMRFVAATEGDPEGLRRRAEGTAAEWLGYTRVAGTDPALAELLCRSASVSRSRCD